MAEELNSNISDEKIDNDTESQLDESLNDAASKKQQRRGEYGFYSPNLRLRIAKMALEKGVSKTADHFSDDTGRFVSPSTVASIRNQYLKEVSECIDTDSNQISELPKANTGRPLLLEELDSHILQCVTKIKENGGTVNAAIIKKIAREIIIANNKSLLLEYGGPFELSNAWAERMLKNMGLNCKEKRNVRKKFESKKPLGLNEAKEADAEIITSEIMEESESVPVSIEKSKDKEDDLTKYKLVACPVPKGKRTTRRKFRILKVPLRNMPRRCNQKLKQKEKETEKLSCDNNSVDIPEQELIEMAIPSIAGKRKRGDYASYTSEQRIKMAKMALDVGIAKTAHFFTKELGRFVSPSSIASMRNQYRKEVEKKQNEISELPKGKRGRPLLLGHLDSEIKNAIEGIKRSGGKIGRNMVKSVARDIIIANNRGLLKEYGGPLQLTNTWAESVMKRMGFVRRRNVTAKTNASKNTMKCTNKRMINEFEQLNQAYIDVISNAVSSAVNTHGITDQLLPNYDQYQQNANLTDAQTQISAYENNNQQTMITDQEIVALNQLQNQVDVFPSANSFDQNPPSFYGDWSENGIGHLSCTYNQQDHIDVIPNLNSMPSLSNRQSITTYTNNVSPFPVPSTSGLLQLPTEKNSDLLNAMIQNGEQVRSNENINKETSINNKEEDNVAQNSTGENICKKKAVSSNRLKKNPKNEKRKRGEYGVYTAEQRMMMAKKALEFGVTKAAHMISEEVGRTVSSSTVASMRNLYLRELEKGDGDISELPKGKRGRPLLLGDLDEQIQRCLKNIRINGGVITRMVVVSVARGIIASKNKSLLKENGGPVELSTTWAESVIRRMGFVRQKTESAENSLPADFEKLKSAFLKRICSVVVNHSIPKQLFLNFGQTALKIVPSSSWTTETSQGTAAQQLPTVEIEDKREITSILTASLAGDLLPLQLVYTGKTDQCHPNIAFPDGWNITHSDNHLCTNETMVQYADKILIPYVNRTRNMLGLPDSHKALVIFDVLNMNQDKDFFTRLSGNHIEVVLVPTPCSSILQPLKSVIFGRFRDELYKLFVNWYSNEVCEAVRAGQNPSNVIVDLRLSVLKHLHAQWIIKTHDVMVNDNGMILEGFVKTGIIEALSVASKINNCHSNV